MTDKLQDFRDICCTGAYKRLLRLYTLQSQGSFVVRDPAQMCATVVLASSFLSSPLPVLVARPSHGAGTDVHSGCCCSSGAMAEAV